MRTVLSLSLVAIALAGCGLFEGSSSKLFEGSSSNVNTTGWYRNDGVSIKGNASLEGRFRSDDDKCQGRDQDTYKSCMYARGYTDEAPAPAPAPAVVAASPTDWHARAREARMVAAQLEDPVARKIMNGIADNYDRLAGRSEGLSAGSAKSRNTR